MSLHRLANEGAGYERQAAFIVGSGGLGRVAQVNDTGTRVRVTIPDFDSGELVFGPIPVALAGTDFLLPTAGDTAYLVVDSSGQPALAVVFGTGDETNVIADLRSRIEALEA